MITAIISPAEIAFREGRSRHAPGATKCRNCGARLSTCRKCKIPYCPACAEENSGHRRCSDCYPEASQLLARLNPGEVKRTADFVAIVSRYTKLRRAGRQFVGLCPFHSEHTPSFYVDPQRRLFKCFGRCAAGGDIFDFVMLAEQCNFGEALRIVAGVARESERRSRERVRGREGAQPLARAAGVQHSQNARDSILAALDATEARLRAIAEANRAASEDFQTACEPDRAAAIFIRHRITSIPNAIPNAEGEPHGRR